jgi:hypothetical protein
MLHAAERRWHKAMFMELAFVQQRLEVDLAHSWTRRGPSSGRPSMSKSGAKAPTTVDLIGWMCRWQAARSGPVVRDSCCYASSSTRPWPPPLPTRTGAAAALRLRGHDREAAEEERHRANFRKPLGIGGCR